ncbi:4Fe-4S dicluster domain-containing protein [Jatrophihabitans endophyticus]|uniref:4Fe-4S dicluster domain-containing protein n=1 Tax=Jatrophihabitans endophyticus TaxID=1206085 RepID=UPI0019F59F96|nr:4Fe-4S dicluster domain-containing protein [Jatrophihabitans endophyticus]MBE7187558.1 4Fe-4S dicluster domain-containing protein [Jatrophihabitans endophyticus]
MGQLSGPDPQVAAHSGWVDPPARKGFFTDTSVCIGCKACEVACKEWNGVPDDGFNLLGSSYDNTGALGASTWRHVAFIEQPKPFGGQDSGTAGQGVGASGTHPVNRGVDLATTGDPNALGSNLDDVSVGPAPVHLGMPSSTLPGATDPEGRRTDFRWLMSSDVCKHCTHAACLDVCPTGSLFRTEFGTVVVQDDICNGCGYCVPACPFGVIDRRTEVGSSGATPNVGIAQKCTLCYDRLGAGMEPACAQACPTKSIQFGDLDELRERAAARVETLHAAGVPDARLYGEDPDDGIGGAGAMFLLLDEPEIYGLPPDPVVTTHDLPAMWRTAAVAAAGMLAAAASAFLGRRR